MDTNVPTHFHKDDTISEIDIVPDGTYVSVVPDWPATEGTEVSYLSGSVFRRYKMVDGTWRIIDGPSLWEQVAHSALSGTSSLSLSSLEGDTDLLYRLVLRAKFNTAESAFYLRFNASSTAAYLDPIHRSGRVGGGDNHSNINPAGSAQSEISLWDGSFKEGFLELLINAKSGHVRISQGTNVVYSDTDNYVIQHIGGIWTNTADEITSINITAGQNFLDGSEYWLDKRNN